MSTRAGIVCAISWMLAASAAAERGEPLVLQRLGGPVVLDGRPDEAAWQAIAPLPLTQYAPVHRAPTRERSEIRVAYDDDALYAAGWFHDSEPGGVRVNSLYRDRWNGDDAFAIYVDAFNDKQNSKWFGTTPGGIRFDQLVSDDGATLNESWDGFWDAVTTVDERGWFAEVRIPFSTLGFRVEDGRALMGLTVTRLVSRTGERVTFPDIDPRFQFRQPSQAHEVVLEGVRGERGLYLTPYALAGHSRSAGADDDGQAEAGLDVRWEPTGHLTVDLTLNTDFAQVEADEQQVALDRFPLFFPEKRRFFQEGSGLFDFATTGGGRLFHSRQIGLDANRQPVRVLGGARAVGRIGAWDVGLLDLQTDDSDSDPGENFGVARARRAVFNPHSTLGAMATSRAGGGRHNLGLGLDGVFRVKGDDYLTLKWAGTRDDADPEGAGVLDRSLWNARWQRRTNRGLSFTTEFLRVGPDYRPELGFLPRRDVTTANAVGNWYFFKDKHKTLRRIYPGALAFHTFRNRDRALETGTWAVWVQWDTKAGGGGWIEPKVFLEDVVAPFRIGERIAIPAGRHTFADLQLVWLASSGSRLRANVDFRAGTFFDGTRQQLIVAPTWNVSPHLELGGSYQLSRLRFPDRGQAEDIHLARLQVRTALNARASANAFVQYNSTNDRLDLNLRLRYNVAEGQDLWLVYDEGVDTERDDATGLGLPRGPRSLSRALLLKLTWTVGG
jgi:hypothetical protein